MRKDKFGTLDFTPSPVEDYKAPNLPTLDDISEQPELLKKLPERWKRNSAILAFAGLIAPFVLSGCGGFEINPSRQPIDPSNDNYNYGSYNNNYFNEIIYTAFTYDDLLFRLHGGGAGFAAYIVYLTEQESLNFIRYHLEKAGLRFGNPVPPYTAIVGWDERDGEVGLSFYDRELNVAVAFLNKRNSDIPFVGGGERLAEMVSDNFAKETRDIQIGVFYTHLVWTGIQHSWDHEGEEQDEGPTAEEIENAKKAAHPRIVENLMEQIESFVELLRDERVL